MCNRSPGNTLPEDTVANAVNVDFGAGDRLVGRKGVSTKVYAGVETKKGFSCPVGVFFIEGPSLKQLNANNTAATLYTGLTGTEFAFWHHLGVVYFSDGVVSLKIVSGAVVPWGLPVPTAPVLYATSGTLTAGVYLAAVCWVGSDGVESGASTVTYITTEADWGIIFSHLPQPTTGSPAYLRLYLSTPNGSELYHVADVTPGTENYTVSAPGYDDGMLLESLFVSPAPAGRIIRVHNGRAFIADADGYVWHSDPFEYDRFRLGSNFLMFPDQADIMEPVKAGIFFAYGNVTDFYAGDVTEGFDVRQVAAYGGVYGTGKKVPNSGDVCWQSQTGMVVGGADGQLRNLVDTLVAPGTASSGASIIREQDGMRQFIVKMDNPEVSRFAAQDFMDFEVVRKGA